MFPTRSVRLRHALSRATTVALIAAMSIAVLGASGCTWFRKDKYYGQDESQRPLEFPPAFDQAEAERSANASAGSVSRSSLTASGTNARALGFTVAGDRASVFAKVGDALAAIPGLTVASRAQLLGAYDVDYQGQKFLVRVSESGNGSQVSAVDPRGVPADHDAASSVVATLKTALGGN
jgi:uncharacterized lipoprotein